MAKWEHYKAGTDLEALAWASAQAAADAQAAAHSTAGRIRQLRIGTEPSEAPEPTRMGRLIGSYATVARLLDEIAEIPGVGGVMLTFDDFLVGMEQFGHRVLPLMRSRNRQRAAA